MTVTEHINIDKIFLPYNLSDIHLTDVNPTYLITENICKVDNKIKKTKVRETYSLKTHQFNNKTFYTEINQSMCSKFREYLNQYSNFETHRIGLLESIFKSRKQKFIFNVLKKTIPTFDWIVLSSHIYRLIFPGDIIIGEGFQFIKKLEIDNQYYNVIIDHDPINKQDIFVGRLKSILLMLNQDFTYQDEYITKIDYEFFIKDEIRRIEIR